MFNGKFSYSKFSLNAHMVDVELNIAETYSTAINGVFGHGKEVNIDEKFQGTVSGSANAFNGLVARFDAIATVFNHTLIKANIIINENVFGGIGFKGRFDKVIYVSEFSTGEILSDVDIGKSMFISESLNGMLVGDVRAGKIINERLDIAATVYSDIDIDVLEYQTAIINVTIPPGGEIRVDSDVFSALLGNQSIMHLYEGDWIMLERDAKRIVINNGTGASIVGEIIYVERYL